MARPLRKFDSLPVRLDADLLASELGKGKSLDRIQAEQGWSHQRMVGRLAVLRARNRRLAPQDGEDAFHGFVDFTRQGIEGARGIREEYTQGGKKTVVRTHTTQISDTETETVREETPARGGISPSEFLQSNRDMVRFVKEIIELGQALGYYPTAPTNAGAPQPPQFQITQIIAAIRTGDLGVLQRMADGIVASVTTAEVPVTIDVPNLADTAPSLDTAQSSHPSDDVVT